MGSRMVDNLYVLEWRESNGRNATHGIFSDAADFGEIVFNCTAGAASLAALESAGVRNLKGKILVDVSNPLDFSRGMPPKLTVCNTDSLGEQIQHAFPETKVVKTLKVGVVATNTSLTYKWKAALKKGSYTYSVLATDAAGNVATNIGSATLKVK